MNNSDEDDEEKMRLAFEAFMLTGKKAPANEGKNDEPSSQSTTSNKSKKKKKKKRSSSSSLGGGTPPNKPLSSTPSKSSDGGNTIITSPLPLAMAKADKKRYYQLLRSFNDKVQHTWYDLDDQLLSVLQNIVSIRGRLPVEWKVLHSSHHLNNDNEKNNPEHDDDGLIGWIDHGDHMDSNNQEDWKHFGFLGKPKEVPYSFHLHQTDVQLALANDMTQHEKMLAALRSLMSNLAECHDGLGRVVDNIWKFHLECQEEEEAWESRQEEEEGGDVVEWMIHKDDDDGMQSIVQHVTDVYQMLSMELYRKQSLVPLIIESTEDEILGIEKQQKSSSRAGRDRGSLRSVVVGSSDGNSPNDGLQNARKCCKSWQRTSRESCIDASLMSHVLKLGEIPQHK